MHILDRFNFGSQITIRFRILFGELDKLGMNMKNSPLLSLETASPIMKGITDNSSQ